MNLYSGSNNDFPTSAYLSGCRRCSTRSYAVLHWKVFLILSRDRLPDLIFSSVVGAPSVRLLVGAGRIRPSLYSLVLL